MTVNGLKIYGEIPYFSMLFSAPLCCVFFLSLLSIKFRTYIPQKPCNAQIVFLVPYPQETSVAQLVAHSWIKGIDAWFESRQNHTVFSHHISPCKATFFPYFGSYFFLTLSCIFPVHFTTMWQPIVQHDSLLSHAFFPYLLRQYSVGMLFVCVLLTAILLTNSRSFAITTCNVGVTRG